MQRNQPLNNDSQIPICLYLVFDLAAAYFSTTNKHVHIYVPVYDLNTISLRATIRLLCQWWEVPLSPFHHLYFISPPNRKLVVGNRSVDKCWQCRLNRKLCIFIHSTDSLLCPHYILLVVQRPSKAIDSVFILKKFIISVECVQTKRSLACVSTLQLYIKGEKVVQIHDSKIKKEKKRNSIQV